MRNTISLLGLALVLLLFGSVQGQAPRKQVKPEMIPTKEVRELAEKLSDPDEKVRLQAAEKLSNRGGRIKEIVAILRAAQKDEDPNTRQSVTQGLEHFEAAIGAAVKGLSETLLKDPNREIRRKAASALGQLGPLANDVAVPALVHALKKDDCILVRRAAAGVLGTIGPQAKAAVPALIEALNDKDGPRDAEDTNYVSRLAVQSLGRIGPEARIAIPALIQIAQAKEKDQYLRRCAVTALGRIGPEDETVIPTLIHFLRNREDLDLASTAARAVGWIGPKARAAVPDLLELLKAHAVNDANLLRWARQSAVCALGDIGPEAKPAVPALVDLLNDQDDNLRRDALQALGKIGPAAKQAIPPLIQMLREDRRTGDLASEALGGIGPAAIPPLLEVIKDQTLIGVPWLPRGRAVEALGHMGPAAKEVIPLLEALAQNEQEEVGSQARRVLRAIRR